MADDGDFPTKSRKVPTADSTSNFYQEHVVGNKTDAAVTTPTTTKSLMGYMKGALNQLSTIIGTLGKDFVAERNEVTWSDVNNTVRFEVSIIDNDSGPVPAANITPGTITISRVRAGVITVILPPAAFSEVDGKIYYDYTFLAASWATDDSFIADADGVEFTIGGSTRYPSIPAWFGVIQDTATIEGKIDTIDGVVDGIQTDLDNATDGLGALKTEIDANETKIDLLQVDTTAIIADLDNATDGLGALKTEIDANETKIDLLQVDTTAIIADLDNATDGLGALKTEIDANETKIDLLQVDSTAIKAVTDLLPDAGALTSLAQDLTVAKEATLGTHDTDIKARFTGVEGATFATGTDSLEAISDKVALEATLGAPVGASLSADIAAIPLVTPDAAGTAATLLLHKESQTIVWSNIQPLLIIPAVAANLDFPTIHIPTGTIPSGATKTSVRLLVKWRKQVDSSGTANATVGATTIRAMKSTGTWGVDDLVAIDIPNNSLATDGSATEGGDIVIGDNDIKAEIDEDNVDYKIRSAIADAMIVDAASLTLVDVQCAFVIRFV